MNPKIYVYGYPGPVGGACTELWATLKLWRANGWDIHLVSTWGEPPEEWRQRCGAIGCITHPCPDGDIKNLREIPGLEGATVVSFCNENFLPVAGILRQDFKCKIIWSGCMNWMFPAEKKHYEVYGPFEGYHCQSKYQIETLAPQMSAFGVKPEKIHLIWGAFDPTEFPFNPLPRETGKPFVIGRLSREAIDKFSTNTWPILGRVNYPHKKYMIMGWIDGFKHIIGAPPEWAEVYPAGAMPSLGFLKQLHCYCQIAGLANENWPRTGLECLSMGIPIIVERRGGWLEMLEHRETGFICETDNEISHWAAALAWDDDLRLKIARNGRDALLCLADPVDIAAGWENLWESVQ